MEKKKVFITSALPYCNNVVHLGNIIGSILSADVCARYLRKKNNDVMFVCGTDDYGTTTKLKALKEGISCEALCEKYRNKQDEVYKWFNISFDVFGKTATKTHETLTQEIFTSLNKKNLLKEKTTEQYFCEKCNKFICDRFIHGICYLDNCGGLVKGDECDKCCKMIDVDRLDKKWCSVCNEIPQKKETTHLYYEIEPYKEYLNEYFLNGGIKYLSPVGKRITKEWLNKELHDKCITRDLKYGVKLPNFENFSNYDSKVSWPWFDAPVGYISILADSHPTTWKEWVNSNTDWYQFMAKDNVPFHTVVFPSTLIGSEFQNLNCGVTHLSATEYLLFDNKKFSKSDGVGIFGDQVIELSKKINIDEDYWRYYLIKIRPETSDSTFNYEEFCAVIKGELAQKIGNLVNRTLSLAKKKYPENKTLTYDFTKYIEDLAEIKKNYDDYISAFDSLRYCEVIKIINKFAELGNLWFIKYKPFSSNAEEYLLGNISFLLWIFAELSEPIIPNKSKKIRTHFHPIELNNESFTLYDTISNIINIGTGSISIDHANTELLFNQVDVESITRSV